VSSVEPDDRGEKALLKREGLDSLHGVFAYAGGELLSKPNLRARQRLRLRLVDESGRPVVWYLKRYGPEPWPVRLWGWLAGRERHSAARTESENIRRLESAGVATMRMIAMGEEPDLLGVRRSYIVLSAVPGGALERSFTDFLDRAVSHEEAVARFNSALVDLVRKLHSAGYVHRDLYASHIFLDESPDGPELYLIDLARMFAPRWRRYRWRVKDLSELKYSMPAAWVEEHWEGFLTGYLGGRGAMSRWAASIDRKVAAIRRRERRKQGARRTGREEGAAN